MFAWLIEKTVQERQCGIKQRKSLNMKYESNLLVIISI